MVRYVALMHRDRHEVERVASEVRGRRRERGWTLDEAATRLGVSRRLLVQIEAGEANPSLSTLLSISAGFGTSLVELLSCDDEPAPVVRSDNASAPVLWHGPHGGEGRLLAGSGLLELWHWTVQPSEERSSDAHQANSYEVLTVTAGAVTLCVGSADPVVVRRGQSAMFRADEPHVYRNDGARPATFVMAVHDPSGAPR
ncbi:MAG: hypothetical protein RI958_2957 [Actinomycetota bacterium]